MTIDEAINDFVRDYYAPRVVEGLQNTTIPKEVINTLQGAVKQGSTIHVFGNGGSYATAQLFRDCVLAQTRKGKKVFINPIDMGELSEYYDTALDELMFHTARPGDVALLVSASGNSQNLCNLAYSAEEENVQTIAVTSGGRLAGQGYDRAHHALVIPISDQQIHEDVATGAIVDLAWYVANESRAPFMLPKNYSSFTSFTDRLVQRNTIPTISAAVLQAFKDEKQVRIEGADDPGYARIATHMAHNLQWDVFQGAERTSNKVDSGASGCHTTGVSNDGGARYVIATEIDDNYGPGDVLILLCDESKKDVTNRLMRVAERKGVPTYVVEGVGGAALRDGYVQAQMFMHMTSRATNARLRLYQGLFEEKNIGMELEKDLAMLRKRDETELEMGAKYGP